MANKNKPNKTRTEKEKSPTMTLVLFKNLKSTKLSKKKTMREYSNPHQLFLKKDSRPQTSTSSQDPPQAMESQTKKVVNQLGLQ